MNTLHYLLGAGGPELGGLEWVIIPFVVAFWVFWLWMLVDCIRFEQSIGTKVVWILIILFASCVGAPLYYFVRKRPRDRE